MIHVGFYPGSFDPVTNGHLDVVQRALKLVDELHIAIGTHHEKRSLFSADERVDMLQESLQGIETQGADIKITTFSNLVVDAMADCGAGIMIRGLRDTTDYNYEMQLAGMNRTMAPNIEVVFLAASPDVRHIAASLVRQIAAMGGDISGFVPKGVQARIREKVKQ